MRYNYENIYSSPQLLQADTLLLPYNIKQLNLARMNNLPDIFRLCLCLNSRCKVFGKEYNNLFL